MSSAEPVFRTCVMASKTASLSVEGVGGKTSEDGAADNGAGSKVSSPSSKQADRGDDRDGAVGAATGGEGKASDGGMVQEGKTSPARDGLAGTGATPAGESSTSSSAAGPIIVEAGGRRKGPNLVQRFVDFVFRVIHTEMDSFFTEHAKLFDQDWEDFNQQGETLEQFQVSAFSSPPTPTPTPMFILSHSFRD